MSQHGMPVTNKRQGWTQFKHTLVLPRQEDRRPTSLLIIGPYPVVQSNSGCRDSEAGFRGREQESSSVYLVSV